ncbi:ABC transporter substrate-binding protein [Halalkalibacter nanhaiisediminis]|uniref:NitT/TauT family transport system substrate-binding protein n=1 Tax=Halalkalibacter nanhaiisediminis TaxID=688079 RepID=A0A562QP15_9BACI|nr:ABC transporter substrate-binding protein [Halalkalibacter nanhaiisediminis]TWI57940.1 NitT/TauT family transport system substrate-binding protein [Halalkalibacter nanhaiisediminis]
MKKLFAIPFLTVALLLTACGSTPESTEPTDTTSESEEKPQLNIGYVSILANAPGIVADQEGFFAEELNVNTYAFNSGPELYQALAAGELDVAYAGVPALVNWASRGLPVKVISKVNDGKIGVVVAEDSGITSVKQLEGEVLAGVQSGSGVDIITKGIILPKAGLLAEDVTIQEFNQANIEAALDSNQAKAGFLNEPFLTYALLRGKQQIAEENDPALVIVASEEALANKSEAVQTFMNIHQSTIDYLNEDPENANQVLVEVFNIGAIEGVAAEDVIAQAKEKLSFDWQFTSDDFTYYQELADAAYELGYVNQEIDVESLFDLTFVEGVIKE